MTTRIGVAVVGMGPAGTALIDAARTSGALDRLVTRGLRIIDSGWSAAGRLGEYTVRSDTSGRVFVECAGPALPRPSASEAALLRHCATDGPVPLEIAAELLTAAGRTILAEVRAGDPAAVVTGEVAEIRADGRGAELTVRTPSGIQTIAADAVVVAAGARPHVAAELARLRADTIHSDAVIRGRIPTPSGRIAIVGGAHSAFSAARVLLSGDPQRRRPPGWLTVVHRSPIRITYPNPAAAAADGCQFSAADICPGTGRVFRYGGLRADSAALYRSVRDAAEPRIRLVAARPADPAVTDADVVVAATGYAEAVSPLLPGEPSGCTFTATGELTVRGQSVPGVYGIGLGAGRRRDDTTGGEPSFTGRIDGVWFYRGVVAPSLLERIG